VSVSSSHGQTSAVDRVQVPSSPLLSAPMTGAAEEAGGCFCCWSATPSAVEVTLAVCSLAPTATAASGFEVVVVVAVVTTTIASVSLCFFALLSPPGTNSTPPRPLGSAVGWPVWPTPIAALLAATPDGLSTGLPATEIISVAVSILASLILTASKEEEVVVVVMMVVVAVPVAAGRKSDSSLSSNFV